MDHKESVRKNNKLSRLLKQATFPEEAAIEENIYDADRKLNKDLLMRFSTGNYIAEGRDIVFKGVSGAGKTWLATAYGSYTKLMKKLIKVDLLIIDEWLLFELSKEEANYTVRNHQFTLYGSEIKCLLFSI